MAKGILEYNLPEDKEDFELAQNAWKFKSTLLDVFEAIRTKIKYTDDGDKPPFNDWEEFREWMNQKLNENDCDIYD